MVLVSLRAEFCNCWPLPGLCLRRHRRNEERRFSTKSSEGKSESMAPVISTSPSCHDDSDSSSRKAWTWEINISRNIQRVCSRPRISGRAGRKRDRPLIARHFSSVDWWFLCGRGDCDPLPSADMVCVNQCGNIRLFKAFGCGDNHLTYQDVCRIAIYQRKKNSKAERRGRASALARDRALWSSNFKEASIQSKSHNSAIVEHLLTWFAHRLLPFRII
jgi:hypothetical protein